MELNKVLTYEEQADRFEKSHLCDVVETSSDEEVLNVSKQLIERNSDVYSELSKQAYEN